MFRHADDGPKCPACRSSWIDATTGKPAAMASPGSKKRKNREGYENFGAEAGLPSERDTSEHVPFVESVVLVFAEAEAVVGQVCICSGRLESRAMEESKPGFGTTL